MLLRFAPSRCFWLCLVWFAMLWLTACNKGKRNANQPPDTRISIDAINLTGDNRLNSTVSLSWFGTDPDGYVAGYEISLDGAVWHYTERQDSTFSFSLPAGQDTSDIDFYVRAIDNEDLADPDPAYLRIPLKNTPPTARFKPEDGPRDTALAAVSLGWSVSDPDGNQSVQSVEMRFNDGPWYRLSLGQTLVSVLMDPSVQSGEASGSVYYGTNNSQEATTIAGLRANELNTVYLRAADIAGAQSAIDTSGSFFFKAKSSGAELLWVSGQNANITAEYRHLIASTGINYDLLHYGRHIDGRDMPSYWDPTFRLIASLYPKMFVNAGQGTFPNRVNGQTRTLLEFMAPAVQIYSNNGNKSFITTSFKKEQDLSLLSGPYPLDSLVTPSGQARMVPDSALVSLLSGNYPDLSPTSVQSGLVPITPISGSDPYYRGQLLKLQGWQGSDIVATVRRPDGNWNQVFFALELHNYDSDLPALEQLFNQILINEF